MSNRTFEWTNRAIAFLFAISAVLQLNDPDPWLWIAIYVAAAAACLVRGGRSWLLAAAVGIAGLTWSLLLLPRVLPGFRFADLFRTMTAGTPAIELGREALGLLIIAGWMAVVVWARPRPETR